MAHGRIAPRIGRGGSPAVYECCDGLYFARTRERWEEEGEMTNRGAVLGLFGGGRFGQAHGVHRVPEGEGTALRGDGDSLHGRVQLY